ncbi:hypothetical protein HanRHA438_Chr12g0568921 [Helianthus annuus]|nr:hypothetical protein HanRHA438_Chr12g0568921 [Helianthus annuus]
MGKTHANGEIVESDVKVGAHQEQVAQRTGGKKAMSLARLSVLPAQKVDPTYRESRTRKRTPMECVCVMVQLITFLHAWDPCLVLLLLEACWQISC